jgi:hypothetical protein
MQQLLDIETDELPVLWDCDFLLGPRRGPGNDTYVLCEINVSSVSPFPDSAVSLAAEAALARTKRDKSSTTTERRRGVRVIERGKRGASGPSQ